MNRITLVAFAAMTLMISAPQSVEAQGRPARPSLRDQWQHSPHARSMDTESERERMNTPGCARCHTAQGYHHETLGGLPSAAPYPDAEGLTCRTCHQDREGTGVGPLRAEETKETCRGCHDELVTNRPNDLSWCSQWGIFEGTGGMETAGTPYPSAAHSELGAGCVSCHMAGVAGEADPLAVGGHTFRVRTKGVEPEVFNLAPCMECHSGLTVESVNASQDEVRRLLDEVAALLPRKAVGGASYHEEPRFPADPTLTPIQQRAAYNYWLVAKDGSLGIHNPTYTRALLQATVSELRLGRGGQRGGSEGLHPIDHLIWAVPDLATGREIIEGLTGTAPGTGGIHPGRGTRNALLSSGPGSYLEIIAPDPAQAPLDPEANPTQAFAKVITGLEAPEIDMFAFSVPDLETVAERARTLGLEVVGPSPGERRTPDGTLIRWSHVDFLGHEFGQFLPFAINWLDSVHPSRTAPVGPVLRRVVVEHPRADELRRLYEGLGIEATVVEAPKPRIVADYTSGLGPFSLTSGESLLAYYEARRVGNIR